ncbi:MAG: hypothetical protein WC709_05985 [Thermoleophilia bacterium]
MRKTQQILAILTGAIGALLIARSVAGGQLWPLSIQLIAGVLLVVMAVLRWRGL